MLYKKGPLSSFERGLFSFYKHEEILKFDFLNLFASLKNELLKKILF